MQISYLISAIILLCLTASSQEVSSAINITSRTAPQGSVCDESGNVYLYGCSRNPSWPGNVYQDFRTGNKGSYILKYSPTGALQVSKSIDAPLFIHQMIHDGTSHFYF